MKKIIFFAIIFAGMLSPLFAQNTRNMVLYNLTSTDCGPCSCMDSIINRFLHPQFPKTIVIALHGPGSYFHDYQGNQILRQFKADFDPSGFIDGLGHDVLYSALLDSTAARYTQSPETQVNIQITSKTFNVTTRDVDLGISITNQGAAFAGPFWWNIFITEDGLVQGHRTLFGCSTPDEPRPPYYKSNYINNDVIRALVFDETGDSLVGPNWLAGQTVARTKSIHLNDEWNAGNCYINIVVYRKSDSLYKSPVQQALRQSVTGGLATEEPVSRANGIRMIYPSPAEDRMKIICDLSVGGPYRIEFCDLHGNVFGGISETAPAAGIFENEIRTEGFPPGVFFAVLTTRDGISRYKFIIR